MSGAAGAARLLALPSRAAEPARQAHAAFGTVLLLDCHSMPSLGSTARRPEGAVDFALGDRFGRSCSPLVERVEAMLRRHGFRVARNRPYAGGHITARYGRPEADLHALQIEVRRGLFMEEDTRQPYATVQGLELGLRDLLADLAAFVAERGVAERGAAAGRAVRPRDAPI